MAVATATALAVASLAATAASTGASFAQAGEQQAAQQKAQQDAAKAMEEARKKLEINYYAQQGINKEPYNLQREALLSTGAQAIQAGVESERGASATAGQIYQAQNQAQAGITGAMSQEMMNLENKQLAEQSRLRDQGVNLDLGEVAGAQQAARDAQKAYAAAMTQGFQGVSSMGQQAIQNFVPLYAKQDNINPLTGLAYTTTDVSNRPTTGQYALPTQQAQPNPFGNTGANPFAQYYTNPSIGG